MTDVASLNAARKRRAGLSDTGCCPCCGRLRYVCRLLDECGQPVSEPAESRPFPNGRPGFRTRLLGDTR